MFTYICGYDGKLQTLEILRGKTSKLVGPSAGPEATNLGTSWACQISFLADGPYEHLDVSGIVGESPR